MKTKTALLPFAFLLAALPARLNSAPLETEGPTPSSIAWLRVDGSIPDGMEYAKRMSENGPVPLGDAGEAGIPAILIESKESLDSFVEGGKGAFNFGLRQGGESFSEYANSLGGHFFDSNSLLLLCMQESSGSVRHRLAEAEIEGGALIARVQALRPGGGIGTSDMAVWIGAISFPKLQLGAVDSVRASYAEAPPAQGMPSSWPFFK